MDQQNRKPSRQHQHEPDGGGPLDVATIGKPTGNRRADRARGAGQSEEADLHTRQ